MRWPRRPCVHEFGPWVAQDRPATWEMRECLRCGADERAPIDLATMVPHFYLTQSRYASGPRVLGCVEPYGGEPRCGRYAAHPVHDVPLAPVVDTDEVRARFALTLHVDARVDEAWHALHSALRQLDWERGGRWRS